MNPATIASLTTAAGTLVLAVATFGSTRSANRASKIAERSLQAALRPVLVHAELGDPRQKIGFVDQHWVHVEGPGAVFEVTQDAIYLAFGLRNVGSGIAILQAWYPTPERVPGSQAHAPIEMFRPLSRALYVPPAGLGFWQGALRDPEEPLFASMAVAQNRREPIMIDVLYSDMNGGQRTVTRISMMPARGEQWVAAVGLHWRVEDPAAGAGITGTAPAERASDVGSPVSRRAAMRAGSMMAGSMMAGRLPLDQQVVQLRAVLTDNTTLTEVLDRAASLGLPCWYLAAGALYQTVWNAVTGQPPEAGILDYDLVYFDDSDVSWEAEDAVIRSADAVYEDLTCRVEVRNQARVHLWYEQKFGVPCPPHESAEASIDTYPTTAACLGVRLGTEGRWSVYAPYGLSDLFNLVVRPNTVLCPRHVYEAKAARWRRQWPSLAVLPWPASSQECPW